MTGTIHLAPPLVGTQPISHLISYSLISLSSHLWLVSMHSHSVLSDSEEESDFSGDESLESLDSLESTSCDLSSESEEEASDSEDIWDDVWAGWNGTYEFPEEHDLAEAEFDPIPSDAPKNVVTAILWTYLNEYNEEGDSVEWYTNRPAALSNDPVINDIVQEWNARLADVENDDDPNTQAQLHVYKHNNAYQVFLEHIVGGYPGDSLHYDISEERIHDVLEVFYSTGYIYDRNEAYIYKREE